MKNPFRSEAEAFRSVTRDGRRTSRRSRSPRRRSAGAGWGWQCSSSSRSSCCVWFFRREAHERPPASAPRPHVGRRAADPRRRERDRRRAEAPGRDPRRGGRRACECARRRPGAEHEAPALGLRRGPGARGGGGASGRGASPALEQLGIAAAGRGRRRRPGAGDRGRPAHVRRRPDHHLDPPRGPLELARARRRHARRASASRCRSRTWSSTWRPRPPRWNRGLSSAVAAVGGRGLEPDAHQHVEDEVGGGEQRGSWRA